MRQLGETELYKLRMGQAEQAAVGNAVRMKLSQSVGNIAPEQIEVELTQLKTKQKNKSSFYPLLSEALTLYEKRGLIRLFNLGSTNAGRSPIPTYIPFIPAFSRNRVKESDPTVDNVQAQDRVMFVNLYRIGNWSTDESTYNGLSALDLYSTLESGVVMYKMLVQNMTEKVFESKPVVENLTKIYTNMFAQVMVKTKTTFGGEDFNNDAAYFLIAKFFLKYVLKKNNEDFINSYAMLAIKNRSSRAALESFEDLSGVDYTTLSSFLKSFGEAFFHESVTVMEFEDQWLKMFGEGTAFAVEYAPYLIHFLFAAFHGAILGGCSRLNPRVNELKKIGLPKLYIAVINEIK